MSIDNNQRLQNLKWRVMDRLIAAKETLPREWYQSQPNWLGYVLIVPGVLLVSFLFVGLLLLAGYSVLTFDPIEFIVYEFTLENWRNFLTTEAYYRIFARTVGMATLITVLAVAMALPYAYLTVRTENAVLRKLLLVCLFVPFFTGVIVRAYGWMIILGQNGLVNTGLGVFGIGPIRLIGTEHGVIIGLLQIMIPFAIIMIAPAIQNIDRSLELAASSLGSNRLETFWYVVLPLAAPGIAGATIVVFTLTSATYAIPALVGGGRVDFISNVIYRALFNMANYPLAATFSISLVVVSSIIVLGIFRSIGTGTLGVTEGGTHE
ncbi:ABC transporter permease [Halostagnicola sp. A-GB9-2]|uniref:ABC transporter permease n=1 Tax=Halostagnicola sp. A-GB9-2 TaxID=3048066 RepID=UPI0024C01127|nr:ABC transporter permease [Halostagnicola sp. A-GB9-2]MDJ1434219.1 ABC transporter permease [Halostagnicola sp. A-GB9-2]